MLLYVDSKLFVLNVDATVSASDALTVLMPILLLLTSR